MPCRRMSPVPARVAVNWSAVNPAPTTALPTPAVATAGLKAGNQACICVSLWQRDRHCSANPRHGWGVCGAQAGDGTDMSRQAASGGTTPPPAAGAAAPEASWSAGRVRVHLMGWALL